MRLNWGGKVQRPFAYDFSDHTILLKCIKKGDEQAFSYLFNMYYHKLFRLSLMFVYDEDIANDIIQDLFVKLWLNKELIRDAQTIEAYLIRATHNNTMKYLSRQQEVIPIQNCLQIIDSTDDNIQLTQEQQNLLWKEVNDLPNKCCEIFKMVVFMEMSYNEVSEILNISVNTVKSQMKIGYRQLRTRIKKEEYLLLLIMNKIVKSKYTYSLR